MRVVGKSENSPGLYLDRLVGILVLLQGAYIRVHSLYTHYTHTLHATSPINTIQKFGVVAKYNQGKFVHSS